MCSLYICNYSYPKQGWFTWKHDELNWLSIYIPLLHSIQLISYLYHQKVEKVSVYFSSLKEKFWFSSFLFWWEKKKKSDDGSQISCFTKLHNGFKSLCFKVGEKHQTQLSSITLDIPSITYIINNIWLYVKNVNDSKYIDVNITWFLLKTCSPLSQWQL